MQTPTLSPGHILTRAPLLVAAFFYALGIAFAHLHTFPAGTLTLALFVTIALATFALARVPRIAPVPICALWILLGAWTLQLQPQGMASAPITAISDNLLRTLHGTVTNIGALHTEEAESGTLKQTQTIDLQLTAAEQITDTTDDLAPISGGIRITLRYPDADPLPIQCGDHLEVLARLLRPAVYHAPGAYDRSQQLVEQGVTSTGSTAADRVTLLDRSHPLTLAQLYCRLTTWQHTLSQRILSLPGTMHHLPPALRLTQDDAAMLAAMTTGDRAYLTHSLRAGFERTGSFHMLVVSGLHLAILASLIFTLLRKLGLGDTPATLLTLAASFSYALFTGFATPVARSLAMVTLYLVIRLLSRQRSPLNAIGFATLALLAVNPRSLFDSGLQMTLLSVIAIGGIARPLLTPGILARARATRNLRRTQQDTSVPPHIAQFRVTLRMFAARLARITSPYIGWTTFPAALRLILHLTELALISLIAELAMALPMALYFHRITLLALPVNLLILPLIGLILPAGFLAIVPLLLPWPAIGTAIAIVPAAITAFLLHIGTGIVHFFGSLPVADLRLPAPTPALITSFLAFLAFSLLLAHTARASRWLALPALALAALCCMLPRPLNHLTSGMLLEALDVGQGDCLLIITPDGKTLLIDAGGFGGSIESSHAAQSTFDIGEEVVSPALWSRGIRHLDAVALTHAHADHMGGMGAILRNFSPRLLLVGNNPSSPDYDALLATAHSTGTEIRSLHTGDTLSLGTATLQALAPASDYHPGPEASNNDSLVLRAVTPTASILLEGDAEALTESQILANPSMAAQLPSMILKAGHHGSRTSTTPDYLAAVHPQWAILSCGLHNHYGHPHADVLARLAAAHIHTFRTDLDGTGCFLASQQGIQLLPDCK